MNLLYLTSDTLGNGDVELGKNLLKNFLIKIQEKGLEINVVFCINSAALLTTKNDNTIEILNKLQQSGTIVLTCGTCLDFYNLKDLLKVGEVGSMKLLIELMNNATKIISP